MILIKDFIDLEAVTNCFDAFANIPLWQMTSSSDCALIEEGVAFSIYWLFTFSR